MPGPMPRNPVIINGDPDPLDQERDFLFDIRHGGYCVLDKEPGHFDNHPFGEGNVDNFVIIRCRRRDVPDQWTPWTADGRSYIRKLDLKETNKVLQPVNRIKSGLFANVYKVKATFTDGSDEEFTANVAALDTRLNDVHTVGTGYTHATINGARAVAASGDVLAVYGNGATPLVSGDYNENIVDGGLDAIQVIGMLQSEGFLPAIRVHNNAGTLLTVAGNNVWMIENLEFDGEGGALRGVQGCGYNGRVARCVMHDCTQAGAYSNNTTTLWINCHAYDNGSWGFYGGATQIVPFVHCTAVDNTLVGFTGPAANDTHCIACLASDNGVDYANAVAVSCAWNVSSDGTAPGAGSRINFDNANFANYAGDDFRLVYPQNANGADIDGWPRVREDYLSNIRERDTLIFYAGAHDPYAPGVPTVTCSGVVDAVPAAQGSIWIRFWEMCITGAADPYRYDIHVKRFDNGPLTAAEINDGTYYARSLYAEELFGCAGLGSPAGSGGTPGILQALIAFEAPGDITPSVVPNDENMHLFTNREYYVAVRAVAIDANNVIYEDDNTATTISESSGHQGELWTRILDCVAVEACEGAGSIPVSVSGLPDVNVADLPDLVIASFDDELSVDVPPLDTFIRAGDEASVRLPGVGETP